MNSFCWDSYCSFTSALLKKGDQGQMFDSCILHFYSPQNLWPFSHPALCLHLCNKLLQLKLYGTHISHFSS